MVFVFLWRNLALSFFRRTRSVFPEPSLTLYGPPPSVVRELSFLDMIFEERLPWASHFKSLSISCQIPLDLLRHFPHYLG